MEGTYYLYIARCADNSLYTGITHDLREREHRHNQGHGSAYTKTRLPVSIVYSEQFETRAHAAQREIQIKGWSKQKKEHLIRYGHPTKTYYAHLQKKTSTKSTLAEISDQ